MHVRIEDSLGICELCPRRCKLREGARGACRARVMAGGRIISENYGAVTSLAIDPIEKKPLYHYMAGSGGVFAGPIRRHPLWWVCSDLGRMQRAARPFFTTSACGHGSRGGYWCARGALR